MYRIAHFGDLHLEDTGVEFKWVLRMVDDALERGADHIVFTGDIVDAGQTSVVAALVRALKRRGLGGDEVSIAPGNHDIYPASWPPSLASVELLRPGTAQRNFKRLSGIVGRHNGRSARLFSNASLPYGKRPHRSVAIAALDSTRSSTKNLLAWAGGELDEEDVDAVAEFFDKHRDATHRIVLMHHYPFDGFRQASSFVEERFVEPNAATVRNWLAWAGATLVVCGHIHADRARRASDGFHVVTTDSTLYEYDDDRTGRAYAMLSLGAPGRVSVERIAVDED